jgi:flagellar motor switch protein FliM
MTTTRQTKPGAKEKSVIDYNFRSAGRLSNEVTRSLSSIHEGFARLLATTLDAYLGTALEVELSGLDQLPIKDHIAEVPPLTYVVPFSMTKMSGPMIVECDINLVFPMVDLLLGGNGGPSGGPRELSEIEEEIMQDVFALIIRQAESSWHMANGALVANKRVKSTMLHQYCPPNEKVTCVKFEISLSGNKGFFQLVFPTAFLNVLIQQIKTEHPQRRGSVRYFPRPNIRERILDCDVEVAAEIPGLRVSVKDLLALMPGSVLKLRAPVRTPGMLTAGGQGIFEATPVRNGAQKAAQLGRKLSTSSWERM